MEEMYLCSISKIYKQMFDPKILKKKKKTITASLPAQLIILFYSVIFPAFFIY